MATNKKKRDRYKAQQEARKKGTADIHAHPLVVGWQARYEQIRKDLTATSSEHTKLKQEKQFLEKVIADLEKTTKHEIRMREDMQEAHKLIKESFAQIRDMHRSDGTEIEWCVECDQAWPCKTLKALKAPEDFVITDLLNMTRELDK